MKKTTLALAAALLLAGCGSGDSGSSSKTKVVASFYPLAFVAEQVGGTHVDVDNLTSPGVEPHDLELRPKQVGAIQDADLVLYEENFQSAVDKAVDQAGRDSASTIDATRLIKPLPGPEGTEGHDEHSEDDGHDHGSIDPHLWLDPVNMVAVTEAVRAKLTTIDPENASTYTRNAAALTAELTALDASFTAGLADCRIRKIVTSHAAFSYLANRYDLEQIAIAGIDPGNEPSSRQLAEITGLVRKDRITTVFTEELVSPAIAKTVAKETGVTTATLDPIEGLSDETADETYLTLMAKNLAVLTKANDCS